MILTKWQKPHNCQINVKAAFSAEKQAKKKPPKHSKMAYLSGFFWS